MKETTIGDVYAALPIRRHRWHGPHTYRQCVLFRRLRELLARRPPAAVAVYALAVFLLLYQLYMSNISMK